MKETGQLLARQTAHTSLTDTRRTQVRTVRVKEKKRKQETRPFIPRSKVLFSSPSPPPSLTFAAAQYPRLRTAVSQSKRTPEQQLDEERAREKDPSPRPQEGFSGSGSKVPFVERKQD